MRNTPRKNADNANQLLSVGVLCMNTHFKENL